jgi:hypothetical protein
MGISALPADCSPPIHCHRTEEFALVLRDKGKFTINGDEIVVGPGSLVVTPPNAPHFTTVDPGEPMAIYCVYSPAGSEARWAAREKAALSKPAFYPIAFRARPLTLAHCRLTIALKSLAPQRQTALAKCCVSATCMVKHQQSLPL